MAGSVCVIGAGAAGLITAYTLLKDNWDVEILTRDRSPGGVWAAERVYPGLQINNVHGEYGFSPLAMPPPANSKQTAGRLTGDDLQKYMENFAETLLKDRIRFQVEVTQVTRGKDGGWIVQITDLKSGRGEELRYDKLVLCTGGCSSPFIPSSISPDAARAAKFPGIVFHSANFSENIERVLERAKPKGDAEPGHIVVIGGGRSAQDIATYMTNQGRKVTMVFETVDAFTAASSPPPDWLRKSRFLAVMSPHITLRTRLERFLHTTRLGSAITHGFWNSLARGSYGTFKIPRDSPLRSAHSIFWGLHTNDEGNGRPDGRNFHALAVAGEIRIISPARVVSFASDGSGVVLADGTQLWADAVVLCTGYKNSWDAVFDDATKEQLGFSQTVVPTSSGDEWDYRSMRNPPVSRNANPGGESASAANIYRGIVPAKNIKRRDLAVNGAIFTASLGQPWETAAHWISSYFLGDGFLRLPGTAEEALAVTARNAAWLRRRHPGMLKCSNDSYSCDIALWTWPQAVDQLLEDMSLPIMRSGGNWLTWAFKPQNLNHIENLTAERAALRQSRNASE